MKRVCLYFFVFGLLLLSDRLFSQSLPVTFNPGKRDSQTDEITGTSSNVCWAVPIGSPTYCTPVIAGGKVLIGTLNNAQWDPRRDRGRSVLLCFSEKTGEFLWQLALPKDSGIPYFDSYCVGISSNPTIVGNRAYLTTGRGEVLCLDLEGMANGNDGPFQDEAALYTFRTDTREPLELNRHDADIIWRYDYFGQLKSKPHDTNNCQIIYYDGLLVVTTGNAPDHSHVHVPHPEAPSLLIMDAEKGIPLARDDFDIGSDISHGQWCSPGFACIKKGTEEQNWIFYGAGNAYLYAVEAPKRLELTAEFEKNQRKMVRLKTAWKFHGDPRAQPDSTEPVPPYVMGIGSASYTCLPPPAFDDVHDCRRIYMLFGYDAWNGAKPSRSFLACIDAKTGSQRALWKTGNIEGGAITPIAIDEGLLYFADRTGRMHCYDCISGQQYWTLPLRGDIWAKPLVADGKIYVGTDRRMFYVLQKGREPKILSEIKMPDRIYAPAAAAGNRLFVAGDSFLYAVEGP